MNEQRKTKVTLADHVEDRLLDFLHQHHLAFGDFLPKETELAEQLHISRNSVREGMSRLKAMGIVESIKHCGTAFCRPKPFAGFRKMAEAGLFSAHDRQDFMELRIALELGMCDFIYARRNSEKLAALRLAAANADSAERKIIAEVDFHSRLMAFADNPAASDFREVIVMAFGSIRRKNANPKIVTPTHPEICDVLESGSIDEFRNVMRCHFLPYLNAAK